MIHKTKYLYGVLFSLLFICMLHVNSITASAAPSLSASADKAGIAQGDYVSIDVSLKNNPQISTLGIALNYDSSILQYDSSSWSGGFSGSDMTMASDTGDTVNLSVVCDDSYSADGTVVTVRFLASKNAASIPVRLVLRDMADADLSEVSNCSVTSRVKVPETANTKTEIKESKSSEEDLVASVADISGETAAQQEVRTSNASAGNVQRTSQNVSSAASAPVSGNAKADENYKTGAGIGSDVFLLAAVICGIFALVMAVSKRRESE